MSLFFFLAGYVFNLRPIAEEIFLSARRLLIPFIVFFFIVTCKFNLHVFILGIVDYFKNPELGFWFLFVLAAIRMLFAIILNSNFFISLFFSIIVIVTGLIIQKYFAFHLILFYSPFFIGGYFFKRLTFITNNNLIFHCNKKTKVFTLLVLLTVFFIVFPYFHRNKDTLDWSLFLFQKTVLSILGAWISYQFFSLYKLGIVDQFFEIAGKHSLFIYGLHLLFLPLYKFIGFTCFIPMLLIPIFMDKAYSLIVSNSLSYLKNH